MSKKRSGLEVVLISGVCVLLVAAASLWTNRHKIVEWYRFRQEFEPLEENAQGYLEYRHRETEIVFVRLPGGTFFMGSPVGEADARPVHEVTLSSFMIAKHEVTQAQWSTVMGGHTAKFSGEDLPVENVSWDRCQEFCERTGFSFPSEAQWEYACRAGTVGEISSTRELASMAWYGENSGGKTHPVGEKAPNAFGLHDTHGNVFEWCDDVYHESFYESPNASVRDPLCEKGFDSRVIRGGSWLYCARDCSSSFRDWNESHARGDFLGLRPVRRIGW